MKRVISFVLVLVFSLFLNVDSNSADEIGSALKNDSSIELKRNNIKNKNKDKSDFSKVNNEDIFGDEQAFPFIAGLGKNAAH